MLRTRVDDNCTTGMFTSALLQYGSVDHAFTNNLWFRWEYRPESEFFVVCTDEHDNLGGPLPGLRSRAFIVKINRLVRF